MTLNQNNSMKNLKSKYLRQHFISGLLVTLSITSLALLKLQAWVLTVVGSKNPMDLPDANSLFGGWKYFWWPDMVQVALLLTLASITLIALFSLRLSTGQKAPGEASQRPATIARRPATSLYANPVSAAMN
jgi:hypothetical protein